MKEMNDMKKVLVLGAGMVSRPMVRYLLDLGDVEVTMASRTVSKAEVILDGLPLTLPRTVQSRRSRS